MKLLIVFMALVSLNLMFLIYQGDMNRFIRVQSEIKSIAEECAAGASLYYDEEAFSQGYYLYDKKEGKKYIDYVLARTFKPPLQCSYQIHYREGPGEPDPGIQLLLTVRGRDWFRLGFLRVEEIKREAFYEQKGNG